MCEFESTEDTTLRLSAWAASYDKEVINAIIDGGNVCHVSAQVNDRPYIQATAHWREGERLYVHGARKNKLIHAISKGAEAALAFTHFDGYVLPRAAFSHVIAYRSVVLFSRATLVEELPERRRLLRLFMERVSPGRWDTVRPPTDDELKRTGILAFEIREVSAKLMMQGPQVAKVMPGGEFENVADAAFTPWTGIVPYKVVRQEPVSWTELEMKFKDV